MNAVRLLILQHFNHGNLSPRIRDVLMTLCNIMKKRPSFRPSYDDLARLTKCSRRTVAYAIEQAERLGMLVREHRSVRVGIRCLRASNKYRWVVGKLNKALGVVPFPWKKAGSASKCKDCTGYKTEKIYNKNKPVRGAFVRPRSASEWAELWPKILSGEVSPASLGYSEADLGVC